MVEGVLIIVIVLAIAWGLAERHDTQTRTEPDRAPERRR